MHNKLKIKFFVNCLMQLSSFVLILLTFFAESSAVNCHKCYRLEECPKKNCSDIYTFVNRVYREYFFIERENGLPICPSENESFDVWKKLEIDGWCGAASEKVKNQPCSVARFEIDGPGLESNKLRGVFLGCPTEFLVKDLKRKYGCSKFRQRFESYRNGIVHPRNKFVDMILRLEQCRNNCSLDASQCDLCYGNGCIQANNTNFKAYIETKTLPISLIILAFALFISVTAILAYFCEGEKVGRLDIVQSEADRSALEKLIQNNLNVTIK